MLNVFAASPVATTFAAYEIHFNLITLTTFGDG
jgi:hypothetical protein